MASTTTVSATAVADTSNLAPHKRSCTPRGTSPEVGLLFLLVLIVRTRAAYLATSATPFARADPVEPPVVVAVRYARRLCSQKSQAEGSSGLGKLEVEAFYTTYPLLDGVTLSVRNLGAPVPILVRRSNTELTTRNVPFPGVDQKNTTLV